MAENEYKILFFNPGEEHDYTGEHIRTYENENDLINQINSYGQTRVTVCICCHEKNLLLNTLLQSRNIASIFICKEHYQDPAAISTHPIVQRQNSFNTNGFWQLDAHTDALNANQGQVFYHIQSIMQTFLEREFLPRHGSIQEINR